MTIDYTWIYCPECDEEYCVTDDMGKRCPICGAEVEEIN